jgi:hypothetical protein
MPKLVRTGSLVLLWVCLYVLMHCSFGLTETLVRPEPDARFGGTYRRALANNPATLDPAFVSDIYSRTVVTQISKGLVQFMLTSIRFLPSPSSGKPHVMVVFGPSPCAKGFSSITAER